MGTCTEKDEWFVDHSPLDYMVYFLRVPYFGRWSFKTPSNPIRTWTTSGMVMGSIRRTTKTQPHTSNQRKMQIGSLLPYKVETTVARGSERSTGRSLAAVKDSDIEPNEVVVHRRIDGGLWRHGTVRTRSKNRDEGAILCRLELASEGPPPTSQMWKPD